ncbi:diaminopimelate epimerase [bacterium]|nr:diaminopimelate epimerase [bacterium]
MTTVKVTKMQGCGNDFVILDYDEFLKFKKDISEVAKILCDRNFGVGADGLIVPDTKPNGKTDIAWYFYNSDGSSAQMCGNGIRCFAKYVYDKGLVKSKKFSVMTLAGVIIPEIQEDGTVKVDMGIPILQDEKIPFRGERKVTVQDKTFDITPVSMGNPHCVIFTQNDTMQMAKKYGPDMEVHSYFPEKTNTEFVRVISKNEVELTVYERGCGITLACGTGACATVTAGVLNNLTDSKVKVNLPGGSVYIDWSGSEDISQRHIFMTGPAKYSFTAEYML